MGVSQNHLAWAKYELLAWITWKKQKSVRTYFSRNELNIFEPEDIKKYLRKKYFNVGNNE